jgi:hypothetical protein
MVFMNHLLRKLENSFKFFLAQPIFVKYQRRNIFNFDSFNLLFLATQR